MGKSKHGKKKHQKSCCSEEGGFMAMIAPPGLIFALEFAEDLGDALDMMQAAYDEQTEELKNAVATTREATAEELAREEFFEQLTNQEINAYEILDNFAASAPAGLPDDDDSLEARIEHAEWNTEAYRTRVVLEMAYFEATLAQYLYIRDNLGDDNEITQNFLVDLQETLDEMVAMAKAFEIRFQIEYLYFKADKNSIELDEALLEIEGLKELLDATEDELHDLDD